MKRRISGQRFHNAGSSGDSPSPSTLEYAHRLVAEITSALITKGGRLVIQLGEEPIVPGTKLSKVFDWTILKTVNEAASDGDIPRESIHGIPCIGVGFSDWKTRMPTTRAELVSEVVGKGLLQIEQLPAPLHIGGVLRERQASYGDLLVTLGGGPGVAHLTELYRQRHQPVIPLDLPFSVGKRRISEILNADAMEKPAEYFEYEPEARAAAALSSLSLARLPDSGSFIQVFMDFVGNLTAPRVFFASLQNRKFHDYQKVDAFFERVVSHVMEDWGYTRFDTGKDASKELFLNVEIFEMIQSSSMVVVDLTKLRPNCLLELGLALGLKKKVIITAIQGTKLPFDNAALPCYFWKPRVHRDTKRKEFENFVSLNVNRRNIG